MQPTAEQMVALEKFATGKNLKIAAFAGTGKTTTLRLLAESRGARGLYLAFNKAIQQQASEQFPRTVDCRTTHSLAWQTLKQRFSTQKMTGKLYAKQLARELELEDRIVGGQLRLNDVHQAFLLIQTTRRFCQSADADLTIQHVPFYGRLLGASAEVVAAVREWTLEASKILWARMREPGDLMPLGHDGYLKLWALGQPTLNADYVLLDEAQDTNAVVLGVLSNQNAQIVYVGDGHQQIYEWRGAVNAMAKINDCQEAALTQSFRFGPAIAHEATKVLLTLGEKRPLQGDPGKNSQICESGSADAVLARTNATVIVEVLDALSAGKSPYVVGGASEFERLLSDVYELKSGKPATTPEFFGFADWKEVLAFAQSDEGEDIRTFVQLVEQHGEAKLWRAVKSIEHDAQSADITLSTAHKAKGREWNSVRLAPDFLSSRSAQDHPDAASEVRLFYVAMTRAKKQLIVDPAILAAFTSRQKVIGTQACQGFEKKPARKTSSTQDRPVDVQKMGRAQTPSAASSSYETQVPTDEAWVRHGVSILENMLGKDHPRTKEAADMLAALENRGAA